MAIRPFLAMTAAEIREKTAFSQQIAWMACHFSPYRTGLSNLPRNLPSGSLLIVNDITPIHGHDPEEIASQLQECITALQCWGVLLDFQRPGNKETTSLVNFLTGALPCPVAVSDFYAGNLDCPVFLPPVPPSVPLGEHLGPWNGREIWLELALNGEVISLTEKGTTVTSLPLDEAFENGFGDETLHCHYKIAVSEDNASFTLWRTQEDLVQLLSEAENLGVTAAVGLYQELHALEPSNTFPGTEIKG